MVHLHFWHKHLQGFSEIIPVLLWNENIQTKVRVVIYRGWYNLHRKLGNVDYLLEYAVKSKYLEAKMILTKFLGAILSHFLPKLQKLWSTAQLKHP
jgi:hypothetical protein